jgi:NADH:ubiquinone oxidoreductase subunit E
MKRIGVFVCHCGHNIAAMVDVKNVVKEVSKLPNVVYAMDYTYVCSDPGQAMIRDAIKEEKLDGVIVASCSPTLHENTFRKTVAAADLNPYQFEAANIREQCSWVHKDKEKATQKAIKIIKSMVEKLRLNQSLTPTLIPIKKKALFIGAGIAGMQAALDIAESGYEVVLLDKNPSIGGKMSQLAETFPTLDCASCILTPKMVEVSQHPNITLMTYSEVEDISGYVGNFNVKIKHKAGYVDWEKCNGCGECTQSCLLRFTPQITSPTTIRQQIEKKDLEKLDAILAKYEGEPGALIPVLQDINSEYNYLPEYALKYVSERLKVPLSQIYHVATFYTAFSLVPRGEHLIKLCQGTACHVRGCERILGEIERILNIKSGQTTSDLKYTLETVNCLGACALGPVMVLDGEYHGQMNSGKVKKFLENGNEDGGQT